ncbi:MAG: hypothetical protein ACRDVG_01795 [Jatrophihabitantaceae bacterium]
MSYSHALPVTRVDAIAARATLTSEHLAAYVGTSVNRPQLVPGLLKFADK